METIYFFSSHFTSILFIQILIVNIDINIIYILNALICVIIITSFIGSLVEWGSMN